MAATSAGSSTTSSGRGRPVPPTVAGTPIPCASSEDAGSVTSDPLGSGPVGPRSGTGWPLARMGAPVTGSATNGRIVVANGTTVTSGTLAATTTAPVALSAATTCW